MSREHNTRTSTTDETRAWLDSQPDGTVMRTQDGQIFLRCQGTWLEAAVITSPGCISTDSSQLTVIWPQENTQCRTTPTT